MPSSSLFHKVEKGEENMLVVFLLSILLLIFFYRKPFPSLIKINNTDFKKGIYLPSNLLLSPAFGTISNIKNDQVINQTTISIFLSLLDIHHQYYPCDGIVLQQIYDNNGKFNIVTNCNSKKTKDNEKVITILKTDFGIIKITQIAGFFVRRILYEKNKKKVKRGEYLGSILFGSRVDIEFPNTYKLLVNKGDILKGFNSIIAFNTVT